MPLIVNSFDQFRRHWGGMHNFVMAGDCVPVGYELPPLERIVDEVRRDDGAHITRGYPEPFVRRPAEDIADTFRRLPLDQAMATPFSMGHFGIDRFDKPGGLLHGFGEQVMRPWRLALEAHGFTLTDFFKPYFFISGPNCTTAYHMDLSHVLAWQRYGVKRFCSLKDPQGFAGQAVRRGQLEAGGSAFGIPIPGNLTPREIVEVTMAPGTVLWNVLQTPHWVLGGPDVSLSINISHRGMRLHGELCPHERQLEQWKQAPATAAEAAS